MLAALASIEYELDRVLDISGLRYRVPSNENGSNSVYLKTIEIANEVSDLDERVSKSIAHINAGWSRSEHDAKAEIERVANIHLSLLNWLEDGATELNERLSEIECRSNLNR